MKKQYNINFNLKNSCIADLIVTDMCNMNCKFCIASYMLNKDKQIISIDTLHNFVLPELKKEGITHVGISGGEPSLVKDLPEICKILHDNGYEVNIATNGYNKDVLLKCAQYINYISLSLNSHNIQQINTFNNSLDCQLRLHGLIFKNHFDNVDDIRNLCMELDDDIIIDFSTLRTTNMWAKSLKCDDIDRVNAFILKNVINEEQFCKKCDHVEIKENGFIASIKIMNKNINIFLRDKTAVDMYEPTDKQLVLTYNRKKFYGFNDLIRSYIKRKK